jgi:tetratricopeptide (TPR) repeat protein
MIVLVCGGLLLAGCAAGKKQYELAMQLQKAGKEQEAILRLQEAIKLEPKNEEYKTQLAQLKQVVSDRYASQGVEALQSVDPVTLQAVEEAKGALSQAREVSPENPRVQKLAQQVGAAEEALLAEVSAMHAKAKDLQQQKEWTEACFLLKQVQTRFPNYENTQELISRCREQGADHYYEQGVEAFRKERFEKAAKMFRNALGVNPGDERAREMLAKARENDTKDYFLVSAKEALMAREWDRAVTAYERALAYDASDEELAKHIAHAKLKAGEYYARQARSVMESGYLLKAIETLRLAEKYLPSKEDFVLGTLRQDLAMRALHAAEQFQDQNKFGSAWFWYERLRELDPEHPRIFFLVQDMQDRIKQRVQKSIAVFDFTSPTDTPDAGVIVANNLITYLFKSASGDIKILERENLKSILEEMKLGQIGVVSENTAKEMGRIYGIDVAIMGSVLLYRVDSSQSRGMKTVTYQMGEIIEDNIDYLNWKAKNPNPSESELAAAPPAKITKPRMVQKDLQVEQHKKVGFVQLSFRIVDVDTGENIQVKTIERRKVVEDETSPSAPEAKVAYDPLQMPTDTELLQELTAEVVAEMGSEALRPLRNLEKTYYTEGETSLNRRENIRAVEKFVDTIFDEQLKGRETVLSKQARKKVREVFMRYQVRL